MIDVIDDSALFHRAPYDPVKAREYYLRTRELKGRKVGSSLPATTSRTVRAQPAPARPGGLQATTPEQRRNKRQAAQARVDRLNAELDRLKEVLRSLVEAAQLRSGIEPASKEKSSKKTETKAETKEKPKTAAEKKEAAEKSRENYEKTKDTQSPAEEASGVSAEIESVKAQIREMREDMRSSVSKARAKATGKGLNASSDSSNGRLSSETEKTTSSTARKGR